jgi:hypothetical protein
VIQGTLPTPAAPAAPATAPVLAGGARTAPSAAAIYEGLKAQRHELNDQLGELQGTRETITGQLDAADQGSASQKSLETRLSDVDQRISTVDHMLAANAVQLAQAAAIPGAVVEPPRAINEGTPDEAYVLGGIFMVIVLFPLSIALARRIWRRSAAVVTSFPKEMSDRLFRMEQAVEATAVEVERIGEGQRFLTRLFTEGEGARTIASGAAQSVPAKSSKGSERLP